jgi:hypothetical protein
MLIRGRVYIIIIIIFILLLFIIYKVEIKVPLFLLHICNWNIYQIFISGKLLQQGIYKDNLITKIVINL